jgi:phospholipid/cholesterol/gamma-HCH transport system substrate-binding protein
MRALSSRDPFRVGLVALAAGLVLAVGVVLLSVLSFGTRDYTAVLAQTAGLRTGEDVSVHGVPSGEVRAIELDGSRVRVTFSLDRDIRLGAATTAEVKVATLLGTHYLEVDPRGPGSLQDGTIPLARTAVPFNLQDVLEKGTAAVAELDPAVLARALTEASRTLGASAEQVGPALTGIARLSEVVSARTGQTTTLLRAARRVTGQLAASSGDLVGLMEQANLVIEEITRRRQAIHVLLAETTRLSRNLGGVMRDTRADLGPAFEKLDEVLATLRHQDAALRQLLGTAGPAVRYVANATGDGPWTQLWLPPPGLPPNDACQRLRQAGCS